MSSADTVRFDSLVANESVEARRVVHEFARKLLKDAQTAWLDNREAGRWNNLTRPPTWAKCLTESISARRRREGKTTGRNELIKRHNNL